MALQRRNNMFVGRRDDPRILHSRNRRVTFHQPNPHSLTVAPALCAGRSPPPFEKEDRGGFSYLFRRNDLRIVLFRPCGIAGGPGIFALLRPPREETMLQDPEVRLLPKGRVKHPTMTLRCVRPGSNPTMPPLRTNAYCSFGY